MKKKIIGIVCASIGSILLSALIAFGIFTLIRNKNVAETGNVLGVSWYNETDSVFTITTAEELYELAELSKFYNFKGQMIKLGADIVVNEGNAEDWAEKAPAKKWKPINRFAGTFDGQGHTISGLYAKVFGAKLAMFTNTVQTTTIKNVSLVNTYFESNGLEGLASFVSTGGGKFYKLYSDAILECLGEQVGGLASMINKASKFEECWFDGSIHTTNRDAGGLIDEIANVRVDMKHCLFSGTLEQEYTIGGTRTGAICGRVRDKGSLIMDDCLASGTLTADKTVYTGALVGVVYSGCQIATTNSYVSSDTYHLMVGDSGEQGVINGKPLHLMSDVLIGAKAYEWTTLDFDKYWAAVEGSTPVLKCFGEQGMSLAGVEKAFDISWYQPGTYTYELTTLKQLYGFYILSGGNDFAEHTIKLGADIVVNEGKVKDWEKKAPQNPWFAINKFSGMFDGQGHTISGIYLKNQMTYQGLFAQVEQAGIVKNLSLKNSYFCNDSDGKLAMIGSIAGEFRGKLENVYSDAIVESSGTQAGGIFGRTNDNDSDGKEDKVLITNCWFDGELRMKGQGGRYGGGFVGMVVQGDLDIIHSLNTGICSAEAVNTGVHLGGFIGQTMNAGVINMTDCLSAGKIEVAYRICVGSVFGRATNEERTVNLSNVYATKESYDVTFFGQGEGGSTTAIINGGVIPIPEKLVTGFKAYQWTDLDFSDSWAVVQDGTPVLKAFAKSVPSLAGQKKMIDLKWYKTDKKSYDLKTVEELCGFALVAGGDNFKGKTVKLGADIVVNQATNAPEVEWLPIGNSITYFQGTFDGQGHTIKGINLDTQEYYGGLFGIAGAGSVLKNFRLEDSIFTYSGTGHAIMGSVVGDLYGGATLENVYSNATVVSCGGQAGGLVGRINDNDADKKEDKAVITNCWFDGAFSLKGEKTQYGGGLVGRIFRGDLDMSHCLNTGSVSSEAKNTALQLGGLIGAVNDIGTLNLKDNLNIGTLSVTSNNGVGSIIGRTSCTEEKDRVINIEGTYTLSTSHSNLIGSVSKSVVNGGAIPLAKDLLTGYQAYQWTTLDFADYWAVVESGTPILKAYANSVPSVAGYKKMFNLDWYKADAERFEIRTADEFRGFALVAGGNSFKGKIVELKVDHINLNETEWIPIGSSMAPFQGIFEGNGYTIKGVNLDTQEYYGGLFGIAGAGSVLKNFRLEDSNFTYSGTGSAILGSVVGDLYGGATLENVYSKATVVSCGSQAGGLVGRINDNDADKKEDKAVIQNCWFDGSFSMKGEKTQYGGGLVGRIFRGDLDMSHCLNTGSVSSEAKDTALQLGGLIGAVNDIGTLNLTDSLNIGTLHVGTNNGVGSIIGRTSCTEDKDRIINIKDTYALKNSHSNLIGSVSKSVVNGGAIPLPEELLSGYKAYQWTSLDFSDSWAVVEDDTPVLKEFANKVPSLVGQKKMFNMDWYKADAESFEIKTADELRGFALIAGGNSFKGKTVKLKKDINLKDAAWIPIGSSMTPFQGIFDGNGYTIKGVSIDTKEYYGGLFGIAGAGSVLRNFRLADSNFTYSGTGSAILGSVVGELNGAASLENVYSDATVVSHGSQAGGLVGRINDNDADKKEDKAVIQNCWFDGSFSMKGESTQYGGGIVGRIFRGDLDMSHCLNTGKVSSEAKDTALQLGGLIGAVHDVGTLNLTDSLNIGTISVTSNNGVGSIFGRVTGTEEQDRVVNIEKTYARANSHKALIGSSANADINGGAIPLPEELLTGYKAYQWTELDFSDTWAVVEDDTPVLQEFASKVPSLLGYEKMFDLDWYRKGTYELKTAKELRGLALISGADDFEGKIITLNADKIDLKKEDWLPIGSTFTPFTGTFDGNMHTISGIKLKTSIAGAGFFGEIGTTGNVSNLYITDSTFESTATDLGSVAGINRGTISTVYSDADIISNQLRTGGIIGSMLDSASVDNCWYDGTITLTTANGKQAGGIVGYIGYNTKNTDVSITDCLYTGDLTFEATSKKWGLRIGGIAGGAHDYYTPTITIENCVSAGTVKQADDSKDIVAVSAVYGGFDEPRATTLNLINVYGTSECCSADRVYHQYKANADATGTDPIITETEVLLLDEVALQDRTAYQLTELDFTDTWAARSEAVPGLQKFVDSPLELTGVIKADTNWYKEGDIKQKISNEAEMYGFMKLMLLGETFAGKEICLTGNLDNMNEIKVPSTDTNPGTVGEWKDGTKVPVNKWISSNNGKPSQFAGTFNGMDSETKEIYAISGIYLNTSTAGGGLFGEITTTGNVSNLYIKDSLFQSTAGKIGSVAGISYGTISTIYSDADIVSSQVMSGGIVGNMKDTASVDTCWFDGEIVLTTKNGKQAGGIVGYIDKGATNINVSITECLYTGKLTFEATDKNWALRIGGIVGGAHDYRVPTINVENCISAGSITQNSGSTDTLGVSAVYGGLDGAQATVLNLTNVYGTAECFATDRIYDKKVDGPVITCTGMIMDESALQGASGYQNTNLDFTNTWAARSKEVPGLKVFDKIVTTSLDLTKVVRPDTSWYKAEETRQEILDEADIYGFMKLMAEGNTFAGKEIYLMADLNKMNEVKADTIDKWKAGTEVPDNKWIGATKFAGTFDGQMHTIKGIYLNTTAAGGGLFGEITATGIVKNLYIKDSLFKSTAGKVGSVAGISYGTISTVYSNACVVSSQTMSGGIVGNMKDTASVDTCWYAGDMKLSTKNGKQAGGIVGYIDKGAANINVNITDCLYTGNITFEASDATWALRIGGIVGGAHDWRVPTINLENCVSAGTITQSPSSANHLGVSAVYGGLDGAEATALNFVNVYAIKGCFVEERIYDKKVNGPKVTGTGLFKEKSDLEGVKGYQNTLLDFEDTWVAREGDVPAPKAFTKVIGETVAITGVEQNNWYDANETVFGISSASALKSLATYTDATNKITFKNKTVYLLDDIEINKVEEGTLAAWKAGTGTLPTSWTPIGIGEAFDGIFDGREHTISGIYMKVTNNTNTSRWTGYGLFARTGYNSTVKNFSLVDSYFQIYDANGNANGAGYIANLGSIVGYHHGYMYNVYSNADIVSNRRQVGGIMGYSNSRGVDAVWFDGTISVDSAHGREVGGIVGVMDSNNTFENILFTGEITHNADRADMGIGGIVGITYASSTCTPTLKNVVAAGKITKGKWGGDQAVGSVVGLIYKATVKTENVYATSDLWNVTHHIASGGTGSINGTIAQPTEANLYGDLAKTNAPALSYTNTWVTREGKVPALKAFSK